MVTRAQDITPDYVIAGLEEGYATLMAMRGRIGPAGYSGQSAGFSTAAERRYTVLDLVRSMMPDEKGSDAGLSGLVSDAVLSVSGKERDGGRDSGRNSGGRLVSIPSPSSAAITRADHIICWPGLIPADKITLRRIVGARSLRNPRTGQYLFSWRKIGTRIGADHKAVQRWHSAGIDLLVSKLRYRPELWI